MITKEMECILQYCNNQMSGFTTSTKQTIYNTLAQSLAQSQQRLLLLAEVKLAEGLAQSDTVNSLLNLVGARSVDLADGALAIGVNDQTKQVRAHVVAAKVVESLAEVSLVKVDVDVDKTFEILCRLGD